MTYDVYETIDGGKFGGGRGHSLCGSAVPFGPHSSVLFLFDMCLMEPLRRRVACRRLDAELPLSELRLSSFPPASFLGDSFLSSGLPA